MSRAYIFSDEAGCFSFARNARASKYFLVCTVTISDCSLGGDLLALRRDMVWRGLPVREDFHATEDKQEVRNEVYAFIAGHDIRVDATILEKSKAQPHTRESSDRFYKYAWYYHFKHVGPKILRGSTEAMITAAALGTKKGQAVYTAAVNDVMQQTTKGKKWKTCFPRAVADPCLQIADYCAWAIQRKWERDDTRSYDLISGKIETEYNLWRTGVVHYY
ncbi:DUF3800 domain-containing protein [Fertoebacter nigrum]|uniref:DUF3800 domain-containing protein n=1 Tax=Fertoeibacter niger TaxID=2656921 RepID=A0A8X8KLL5_9RHOB|nr:DUF3800 domain-containing protein [Fertoeibacter niger]NUB42965.1 DUF3800 domain-containing protein [Fertoeibacter niger]